MEPKEFSMWMHGLISATGGAMPTTTQWAAIVAMVQHCAQLPFPHQADGNERTPTVGPHDGALPPEEGQPGWTAGKVAA